MTAIVPAHGASSAAWAWKKMRPLFHAAGHEFFSPTCTCPEAPMAQLSDIVAGT